VKSITTNICVANFRKHTLSTMQSNANTPSQKKNCANFFLSELRQISTNFGNF